MTSTKLLPGALSTLSPEERLDHSSGNDKPAGLLKPTKFELISNLKPAKALELEFPLRCSFWPTAS
jgi:hypothetical protein